MVPRIFCGPETAVATSTTRLICCSSLLHSKGTASGGKLTLSARGMPTACVMPMVELSRGVLHSSVLGEFLKEALDFARAIMDHSKFGDTRAIAYAHMDMSTKDQEYAALANLDGMKDACEFQYYYIDDKGEKVYTAGFVRFRTISGDESAPWSAYYLPLVQEEGESKKICKKCTQGLQRPVWHEESAGKCMVKWTQVGDQRVLIPDLRATGGEKMKLETMQVVDMCEWAQLEGMPKLVDAIRNTVLDGVRVTVSMSSPELSEALFAQMRLDVSTQAIFQAQLDKLRMHGWTRPSTKQVVDSRKVKKQKTTPVKNAEKQKRVRKKNQKPLLGDSEVLPSTSQTAVHARGVANEDGSVPFRAESEQIGISTETANAPAVENKGVAGKRKKATKTKKREDEDGPELPPQSAASVLRPATAIAPRRSRRGSKKGSYKESSASDEEKPLKSGTMPLMTPAAPLRRTAYELAREERIAEVASEAATKFDLASIRSAFKSVVPKFENTPGPAFDSDSDYVQSERSSVDSDSESFTNEEPLNDESSFHGDQVESAKHATNTANSFKTTAVAITTTTSTTSTTVQKDIPDEMRGSDRCVFNHNVPAISTSQPSSATVDRSAITQPLSISSIAPGGSPK